MDEERVEWVGGWVDGATYIPAGLVAIEPGLHGAVQALEEGLAFFLFFVRVRVRHALVVWLVGSVGGWVGGWDDEEELSGKGRRGWREGCGGGLDRGKLCGWVRASRGWIGGVCEPVSGGGKGRRGGWMGGVDAQLMKRRPARPPFLFFQCFLPCRPATAAAGMFFFGLPSPHPHPLVSHYTPARTDRAQGRARVSAHGQRKPRRQAGNPSIPSNELPRPSPI